MEINSKKDYYNTSEASTKVANYFEKEGKHYLSLEKNIFYPQGGGQKGDRGTIKIENKIYNVQNTIKDPEDRNKALLIINEPLENKNKEVQCEIDVNFRNNQTRLHTALHLIHICLGEALNIEMPYPKISSIKDYNTAFNQYEFDKLNKEIFNQAKKLFYQKINIGGEVKTYPDSNKEGFRYWEYDKYKIPCGGTHVRDIKEIGKIDLEYSEKKNHQTIKISVN